MWDMIRRHPVAVGVSVLGHLALLIAFIIGFRFPDEPAQLAGDQEPVKAVVVDQQLLREEEEKLERAEAEQREKEAQARRDEEAAQEQAEAQRQRKEEEARKQAEAERERKEEDARKQAEAERKREEEEARKQAEAERQRKEEEARKQAEAERQRKEEEARKQAEAERKRKEEKARKNAEADLAAAIEAERAAEEAAVTARAEERRLAGLRAQYAELIRQHVERNWIRPALAEEGAECEVSATQAPGGFITGIDVSRCSGGGDAFRRSVESAVLKSEPLPPPPDPALFDRELVFIFKPE